MIDKTFMARAASLRHHLPPLMNGLYESFSGIKLLLKVPVVSDVTLVLARLIQLHDGSHEITSKSAARAWLCAAVLELR